MIENHNICYFDVYHDDFKIFNTLGHRDKQVIRQYLQNFSVVINLVRSRGEIPKVLETGSGLSTCIFSKLLSFSEETLKTIDAFSDEAIQINSRGIGASFNLSNLKNCEIIRGVTIDYQTLNDFYKNSNSTVSTLSHLALLEHLDLFVTLDMDDRKYQNITQRINIDYLSVTGLRSYLLKNKLFQSELFQTYKTKSDEFSFLKDASVGPVLENTLKNYLPNIVYLDSGEYSTVIEFNMIDEMTESGTILIVQDIFFPKSIKSFLVASALMISPRWKVLWIDRTTPQGIIICRKE